MPGPGVGVKLLDDGRLLLDRVGPRAGAGHSRAEEHVDDEHHEEEDPEGHAQVEHPGGTRTAVGAQIFHVCEVKINDLERKFGSIEPLSLAL